MYNIILEKVWQDGELIEIKVSASSQFITAYQFCYVTEKELLNASKKICAYTYSFDLPCYLQFGKKVGKYPPAFSMNILPAEGTGHVSIEMDLEIDDNFERAHRCSFYVKTELGLLELFGKRFKYLENGEIGAEIKLHEHI